MGMRSAQGAFKIIRTHEELDEFASHHDGMCKVLKTRHGAVAVEPDRELGSQFGEWDYYMADEPDCFNFKGYGISQ